MQVIYDDLTSGITMSSMVPEAGENNQSKCRAHTIKNKNPPNHRTQPSKDIAEAE